MTINGKLFKQSALIIDMLRYIIYDALKKNEGVIFQVAEHKRMERDDTKTFDEYNTTDYDYASDEDLSSSLE